MDTDNTRDAAEPSLASAGSLIGVLFVVVLVFSLAASIWSRSCKEASAAPNAAPEASMGGEEFGDKDSRKGSDCFYLMIL
jgi:hypothetical protein